MTRSRAGSAVRRARTLRTATSLSARHLLGRNSNHPLSWANVVETTTSVELMGRYSNPDIVARLRRVLSGQGRDRVSHRPVPSVRQKQTRLTDSQRSELVSRYAAGESSNALAREFGIDRRTATAIIRKAGGAVHYRAEVDVDAACELYATGHSLVTVGEQLGVSAGTILNLLCQAGVRRRAVGTNRWSEVAAAPPAG